VVQIGHRHGEAGGRVADRSDHSPAPFTPEPRRFLLLSGAWRAQQFDLTLAILAGDLAVAVPIDVGRDRRRGEPFHHRVGLTRGLVTLQVHRDQVACLGQQELDSLLGYGIGAGGHFGRGLVLPFALDRPWILKP